ncbi:MAG TPA: DUF3606 domain-containing protein [Rhodanobacteraceae bacterium]
MSEHTELELVDDELVRYWSFRFSCSAGELFAVVGRVGRSIVRVRAEILRRQTIRREGVEASAR